MADKGGIDRSHASSKPQKAVFSALHFFIILFCAWLVLGGGLQSTAGWIGQTADWTDPVRAHILLVCAFVYFLRHGITLFYLLVRRVEWGEVFGLAVFFALFEIGLLMMTGKLVLVFAAVQLFDNIVSQPLNFSNSIKAHPLEIFIVISVAGTWAGIAGMVVAVPMYSILRIIAKEMDINIKFIRTLSKNA